MPESSRHTPCAVRLEMKAPAPAQVHARGKDVICLITIDFAGGDGGRSGVSNVRPLRQLSLRGRAMRFL